MTTKREYTGGSVSYYKVEVGNPISGNPGYTAECNDIIEALGMNYAEGNAFKAIWRSCAARTLGVSKEGYTDGLYDAEKVKFFGGRMVAMARGIQTQPAPAQPARAEELQADDGWIEWGGGNRPVYSRTLVQVKRRNGDVSGRRHAISCMWSHYGITTDVIAYRVVTA